MIIQVDTILRNFLLREKDIGSDFLQLANLTYSVITSMN